MVSLTDPKRVVQVCQHQLSFLLVFRSLLAKYDNMAERSRLILCSPFLLISLWIRKSRHRSVCWLIFVTENRCRRRSNSCWRNSTGSTNRWDWLRFTFHLTPSRQPLRWDEESKVQTRRDDDDVQLINCYRSFRSVVERAASERTQRITCITVCTALMKENKIKTWIVKSSKK